MVEFGLTFVFFIFIVLACVNLMLVAYNFDTAQRTSWEAARRAAVDGTNTEVANVIYDEFVKRFFGSVFLISKIEFSPTTFIQPNSVAARTEGKEVQINLGFRTGLSLGPFGEIYGTMPVSSRLAVIALNDEDRDSVRDANEALPGDHDNDGANDATDTDDDNDGTPDVSDVGTLTYNTVAYTLDGPDSGALAFGALQGGTFAARLIHVDTSGDSAYEPWPQRPRTIPRDRYTVNGYDAFTMLVDLSYDKDNDGWEDKFDAYSTNPNLH